MDGLPVLRSDDLIGVSEAERGMPSLAASSECSSLDATHALRKCDSRALVGHSIVAERSPPPLELRFRHADPVVRNREPVSFLGWPEDVDLPSPCVIAVCDQL